MPAYSLETLKKLSTTAKRLVRVLPFIIPLTVLSWPYFFLSLAGIITLLTTAEWKYRGLFTGWTLLFAALFFFFRELPPSEKIWAMGAALSMAIGPLIILWQEKTTPKPQKNTSEIDRLRKEINQLRCDRFQLKIDRDFFASQQEEAPAEEKPTYPEPLVEITALEEVVEGLLQELKSRCIPTFNR